MVEQKKSLPFEAARFLDAVKEQVRLYEAGATLPRSYKRVYPPPFEPAYPICNDALNQFQTEQLAIYQVFHEFSKTVQFGECFSLR